MFFPQRPYGALALLLVIFVLCFASHANAAGRTHHRHHHRACVVFCRTTQAHHHHATFEGFLRGVAAAKPIIHMQSESNTITVFGNREVETGGIFSGFFQDMSYRPNAAGALIGAARGQVAAMVRADAERLGVPASLALAVAHFESGFRMSLRGAAGERGAMQVLPQTAWHVGVGGSLYGPAGVEAGVRYLKEALDAQGRYGLCAALSAYNHGLGYVRCTGYGRTVLAIANGAPTLGAALIEARWSPRARRHHRWRRRYA